MSARDLLFEIGTEEIPARFMTWVINELDRLARAELAGLRIGFDELRTTGTPRRTVLYIKGLAERQEDFEEAVKGPPKTQALDEKGEYTKAALGFAKSRGVEAADLRFDTVKDVEYIFAVVRETGKKTEELLPGILSGLLKSLVFPKSMYWTTDSSIRFARPVRWLIALWGDRAIPVAFGSVQSGCDSRGHRFMGAPSVAIDSAESYEAILERESVIVDHERRKKMILAGIGQIEKEIGGTSDPDPELLEENAQLVEYPIPFRGSFDASFLDIPEEVLIATMKKNQRYFPVRGADGKLMPDFIGVSNNKARDMNVVRDGNERVLRARFYDAAFFWKEDLAVSLESRLPSLEKVLYQERLGSIADKVARVRGVAGWLADELGEGALAADVDRAAMLSKADLVTGMVFEFPEVQGVMGREYAKRGGENAAVADALFEQYLPRFAGDDLPKGKVGAIIGLCDRVDTIIGIHKAGLPPTGSQDPYGLRRAARCINEILWGLSIDADLGRIFTRAAEALGADGGVMEKVADFYRQRLHNQLRERGFTHGTTSLAVASMGHRPLQALRMLEAFETVSGEEWFAALITSAIRVNNILSKLPGDERAALKLDAQSLSLNAEKGLLRALEGQSGVVSSALASDDWAVVCSALSELSPAISVFFDEVMVMDEDLAVRNNRLALLEQSKKLFDSIGDFALLKA